jgi:hypothetical protein
MKNRNIFIMILSLMLLFSGCKDSNTKIQETIKKPSEVNKPTIKKPQENLVIVDLSDEDAVKNYLIGEWHYGVNYANDTTLTMKIENDMKINLTFFDKNTQQYIESHKGQLEFKWVHADLDKAPDSLVLMANKENQNNGEYFFSHISTYSDKHVMAWYTLGNENTLLDVLGLPGSEPNPGDMLGSNTIQSVPQKLLFEKTVEQSFNSKPNINSKFHAILWKDKGSPEKLWLDDVDWSYKSEVDFAPIYPKIMTLYENDVKESVLYSVYAPDKEYIIDIGLISGELYYVETNALGEITLLSRVEHSFIDVDNVAGHINPKDIDIIMDIMENDHDQVKTILNSGKAILITGETIIVNGDDCYIVYLGRVNREIYFAVDIGQRKVYAHDVLDDKWILLK